MIQGEKGVEQAELSPEWRQSVINKQIEAFDENNKEKEYELLVMLVNSAKSKREIKRKF
jgi:hypothetical protein